MVLSGVRNSLPDAARAKVMSEISDYLKVLMLHSSIG